MKLIDGVIFQFLQTSAKIVSQLLDLRMGYLTYLMTSSIRVSFRGGYSSEKNQNSSFRYNNNKATKMINMLTHFVNIHAHSSVKHAMINSRVTGTIANKNEGTKLPSILFQSFWRLYLRVIFFHKINRTYQLSSLHNQHNKYNLWNDKCFGMSLTNNKL